MWRTSDRRKALLVGKKNEDVVFTSSCIVDHQHAEGRAVKQTGTRQEISPQDTRESRLAQ